MQSVLVRARFVVLVLLCFSSLVVSTYYYTGYYASDDIGYLGSVVRFASGTHVAVDLGPLRLALLFPATLVYVLTNASIFATIYSFVLYHPLLVIVTYLVGTAAHGRESGLVAASLVAFCPLVYVFAGSMLPDCALGFWVGLWCLVLVRAGRDRRLVDRSLLNQVVVFFLAGVLNGIAYSVKESGLIVAVPGALAILLVTPRLVSKQTLLWGMYYLVGLGSVLFVEVFLIHAVTGKYVFRPAIVGGKVHYDVLMKIAERQGFTIWARFETLNKLLLPYFGTAVMWCFTAVFALYPLCKRPSAFLWVTAVWIIGYLTFGSVRFDEYLPPVIVDRYYALPLVPLVVVAGHVIQRSFRRVVHCVRCLGVPVRRHSTLVTSTMLLSFVVVGLWACNGVSRSVKRAGAIYRAPQVKTYFKAYEAARKRYSQYQLVLSPYTSHRMYSLAQPFCPAPHFYARGLINCNPGKFPKPPFVYVRSTSDKYENAFNNMLDDYWLGAGTYTVKELETFYPPPSRAEELLANNSSLFSVPHVNPFPEKEKGRWGYRLELIEPAASYSN